MTTIAYVDGFMVGDSRMSRGNEYTSGAQKVFVTDYFIVGFSGSFGCVPAALGFIKQHEDGPNATNFYHVWDQFPDFGEGVGVLMVNKNGDVFYGGECPPVLVARKFEAIGTGAAFAVGAMAQGASAERAVEIAASFDVFTGGALHTVSIRDIKRSA